MTLLLSAWLLPRLNAATITKANNTTAINAAGSWVGGVLPGAGDIMLFDGTITGPLTISGGGSYSTAGAFQFTNIGGNVTIGMNNGGTTTMNFNTTNVIDMSTASADVTFGAPGSTAFLRWASGVSGGINVAAGRTLTINSNMSNAGSTKTIAMTGGGNIIFNGTNTGGGGAMGFSIQGGTNVTMGGTGGWSGSSLKTVLHGTLNLASDTALGAATLSLGGTGTTETPTLTATGAARTITNGLTLLGVTTGNATIAGTNALTINGTLLNSGANRTLSVNNTALTTFGGTVNLSEGTANRTLAINGTGNVTISGVVANGGTATASNLTYSGTGLLSLTNANTFAGTLTASSGTTRIDNTLAAQNSTVSVGAANAVTFGTGITTATFGSLSGAGDLALTNTDTNNVALSIGNNDTSTTYSGALSGTGSITKIGTGTVTLSSTTSTYSGGTVISAGRITLSGAGSNAAALGSGAVNLQGGTLQLQSNGGGGTSAGTFANAIQVDSGQNGTLISFGRGELSSTLTGAGTLNLQVDYIRGDVSGNWSAFTGQINVTPNTNGGDFRIDNTNGFGTARINLAAGVSMYMNVNFATTLTNTIGELTGSGTLRGGPTSGRTMTWNVGGANTNAQFDGVIQNGTGPTAVTKSGNGAWTLTGTNTYTGVTTVSAGSLNLTSTGTTGTGAVTVANGGTILGTGLVQGSSFTATSGSTTHAGNGAAQSDYGTLTFTPATAGGSFDFQSGSSVILGINPGAASDLLSFVGDGSQSLLFNGNLNVTPLTGYTPIAAETFNLLDWTSLSSTTFHSRFSAGSYGGYLLGNGDDNLGFDLPDLSGSGFGWDISSFTTNGSIAVVSLVPEPSRALLLMLGIVGVGMRRRRQTQP